MESISLFENAQACRNLMSSGTPALSNQLTTPPKNDEIVFMGKNPKAGKQTKKGFIATVLIMLAVKLLTLAGVNPSETKAHTDNEEAAQTSEGQKEDKKDKIDNQKKQTDKNSKADKSEYQWDSLDDIF